jgi:CTP synthase
MHPEDIISNPDLDHPYEIPFILQEQQLETKIMKKLNLPIKTANLKDWKGLVDRIKSKKTKDIEIAIVGKYFGTGDYQLRDSYAALFDAIDHASWQLGIGVKTRWVDAEKVESAVANALADKKPADEGVRAIIGHPDGIIVPIGWGERGAEGMIAGASYARKHKIPYLGLCYGMQLAAIAFARDIIGWPDATSEENDKMSKHPVIHIIPSQKEMLARRAYGGTMRLGSWDAIVKEGTRAYELYNRFNAFKDKKTGLTSERHRHRYEFNDDFAKEFEKAGLIISARTPTEDLPEMMELPQAGDHAHPWFVGVQFHPELKSRPFAPHPLFASFVKAAMVKNASKKKAA